MRFRVLLWIVCLGFGSYDPRNHTKHPNILTIYEIGEATRFPVPADCASYVCGDARRGKGKRGGLRVIYYWWDTGSQLWLFTIYDKDEMSDLTPHQRKTLKEMIKKELDARRKR